MEFTKFEIIGMDNGLNVVEFESAGESGVLELTDSQITLLKGGEVSLRKASAMEMTDGRATHRVVYPVAEAEPEPVIEPDPEQQPVPDAKAPTEPATTSEPEPK